MQRRRDTPSGHSPGRCLRPRGRAVRGIAGLTALAVLCAGCSGPAAHSPAGSSSLLTGERGGPMLSDSVGSAARLAHRFADAYARSAYRSPPHQLPGATAAVERHLAAAAIRVPPARRDLRPRAIALILRARGVSTLDASLEIADGRSPPFSIGFTLKLRGERWRVVAVSLPS
jgi:hypothetical protein